MLKTKYKCKNVYINKEKKYISRRLKGNYFCCFDGGRSFLPSSQIEKIRRDREREEESMSNMAKGSI